MDKIDVVHGDTDLVPVGGGTMGSRSLQHGGAAVHEAADALVEKARRWPPPARGRRRRRRARQRSRRLPRGRHARGRQTWADLAGRRRPPTAGCSATGRFNAASADLPLRRPRRRRRGRHRDRQGAPLRHVACDDAGRILNPLLLEGQIHGGIAQGAAQALLEEVRYDEDGNPVTANLADYAFISAAELPSFELVHWRRRRR